MIGARKRPRRRGRRFAQALAAFLLGGCTAGGSFDGLAPAQRTGGPTVLFALASQPPQLPSPIDLLTRLDPASPTGLRVDASLLAPTQLQQETLAQLDLLDGFGTFAPLTVQFDQDLDALNLWSRQTDSDPANDAVYLVDLTSGALAPLDWNSGRFPLELPTPGSYFLDDPLAATTNLIFPALTNLLHPNDPGWPAAHGGVPQASDDLLTFYERGTRTLLLQPVLPLAPERSYAVVLTNRLHGVSGLAVQSPFTGINHAAQTAELLPLLQHLPPGTQLSDLAFAWAFTTQSTTRELEALQQGLAGSGPLAALALRVPVTSGGVGIVSNSALTLLPEQDASASNPYLIPASQFAALLADPQLAGLLAPSDPTALAGLLQSLESIDYFISGTYPSPDLLADPDRPPDATAFLLDVPSGLVRASLAQVPFLLAVPKADPQAQHTPPFPLVYAGHDLHGSRLDPMLGVAGTLAGYGLATVSIDAYGCGLAFEPATELLVRSVFHAHGLDALAAALFTGRARDLDGDGFVDPGGDLFSARAFHTRDLLRQTAVDWLQLMRVMASFDGRAQMAVPGASSPVRAGDFNLDGVPDVGGPAVWPEDLSLGGAVMFQQGAANPGHDAFVYGVGLGGVVATLVAALEPGVKAAAVVSTPGGLGALALRTSEPSLQAGLLLPSFGPLLATCPYSLSAQSCSPAATDAQPMLVWDGADQDRESQLPIAPLVLQSGDRVIACDLAQAPGAIPPDAALAQATPGYCRSALADAQGQLRLPLAADAAATLDSETPQGPGLPAQVQQLVLSDGDPVRVLVARAGGSGLQAIDSFQYDVLSSGISFPLGTPLSVLSSGSGSDRNSPAFRQLAGLWQALAEPADPINYAAALSQVPLAARAGLPVNLLAVATMGDAVMPTSAQLALARAAGFIELQQPDPDYGVPIDQVLLDAAAVEGVARLQRFAAPAAGPGLALGAHLLCTDAGCAGPVVADPAGLSCSAGLDCSDGLDAPRLAPPLQRQLWRTNFAADGTALGVSALELADFARQGQHGFAGPQPGKPFDLDLFLANQIGRYFETRGLELHLEPCQALFAQCPWSAASAPGREPVHRR